MSANTDDLLDVLAVFGIEPGDSDAFDLPDVGKNEAGETVYTTSITEVLEESGAAAVHRRRRHSDVRELVEIRIIWCDLEGVERETSPECWRYL